MATLRSRPVEEDAMPSSLKDFVVITGFSGAGKSTAMNVFEDAGYFCVDNLPPEMIRGLVDLFRHPGSKVERAAVVCDVRGGEFFDGLLAVLDELEGTGVCERILFLDAEDEALLTRYQETRRRHPLAGDGSVAAGIAAERAVLGPLRERADLVVDTTNLSAAALRRRVIKAMLPLERERLTVSFTSFGFKHGPVRDADLIFDVRFLPNPHYVPDLKPLTGRDARVVEYVARDGKLAELYERLYALLDFLLPEYLAEGKAHLTIAIGCTGGRHRSVAIAEHLAARYRDREGIAVDVVHRDADLQPDEAYRPIKRR
ncbi:MAG TPA: RNase adapter RapZ [Solirubrobacteraceae bacterium]|nr:RNase adapter RapZ [Solirubrobacteraceae bacterium]